MSSYLRQAMDLKKGWDFNEMIEDCPNREIHIKSYRESAKKLKLEIEQQFYPCVSPAGARAIILLDAILNKDVQK